MRSLLDKGFARFRPFSAPRERKSALFGCRHQRLRFRHLDVNLAREAPAGSFHCRRFDSLIWTISRSSQQHLLMTVRKCEESAAALLLAKPRD
jgi:hypothetical protein